MFETKAHATKPLRWWYDKQDDIDLKPLYQRHGGIWKRKPKAYLIDSILNGYDIPKIYIADFTRGDSPLNVKKKMYAIIDGKQRFEAIFDFFDDNLALDGKFVYQENPSLVLSGLHYSELRSGHPSICRLFDDYELAVMSAITDDERQIAELFVRLNRNSRSLAGAEVRNAMPGIVPILTRELAEHPFFTLRVKFKDDRYQHREAATKLLLVEYRGKLVSTKKADLDKFAEKVTLEVGAATGPYRKTAALVSKTLDTVAKVFEDRDPLLGRQGVVPIYYWLLRQHDKRYTRSSRAFLAQFEEARKENDRRVRERIPDIDEELLAFSNVRRSHNDQGAMMRMYDILKQRFREFLKR